MKENVLAGKYIYENLKKLHAELSEIGEACDVVSDNLGQSTKAYRILNEIYKAKQNKILALENQQYAAR